MMFLRPFLRPSVASAAWRTRKAATASAASKPEGDKWDLWTAVIVERPASLTKELGDIERTVFQTMRKMEDEHSLKCDFELRQERDLENAERKKKGLEPLSAAGDIRLAEDLLEEWKKDAEQFEPAPTRTKADEENDLRSPQRELSRPLRLVVEMKWPRGEGDVEWVWDLPTTKWREGETLRETAERALREICGDGLKVQVLGNAPFAMYTFGHGQKAREVTKTKGGKVMNVVSFASSSVSFLSTWLSLSLSFLRLNLQVFVYKAFYESGNACAGVDSARDFKWLTWEPFSETLPDGVFKCVEQTVCDES